MPNFEELHWEEAMRRGHAALPDSEHLYDDINALEGRSNVDIEAPVARELGSQGDRYGHPGT
jgi:hypothetical protein